MKNLLYFGLAIAVLTSCISNVQISKRKHLKGYYVEISNSKHTPSKKTKLNQKAQVTTQPKFNSEISVPIKESQISSISSNPLVYKSIEPYQKSSEKLSIESFSQKRQKSNLLHPKLENEREDKSGFIFGLTSMVLFAVSVLMGYIALNISSTFGVYLALASLILIVPAFVLSIIGLIQSKKTNNKPGKVFSRIALIGSSIYIGYLILMAAIIALFIGLYDYY